ERGGPPALAEPGGFAYPAPFLPPRPGVPRPARRPPSPLRPPGRYPPARQAVAVAPPGRAAGRGDRRDWLTTRRPLAVCRFGSGGYSKGDRCQADFGYEAVQKQG